MPLTIPIFTAGRIGGEVTACRSSATAGALYRYQQVIQQAFREMEDALIDRTKSGQRVDALNRQLNALRNYARLARLRYDGGYTSYLEVLDAERSLFNVAISYTSSSDNSLPLLDQYLQSHGRGLGGEGRGWSRSPADEGGRILPLT